MGREEREEREEGRRGGRAKRRDQVRHARRKESNILKEQK
jgi:hypothetical protein